VKIKSPLAPLFLKGGWGDFQKKREKLLRDNLFIHIPYKKIKDYKPLIFEKCINLEIYFPSETLDEISLKNVKELKKEFSNYGIRTTFHAPFLDLSPGGFDIKVREITLLRMRQILELAGIIHPKNIVVHPGFDNLRFQGFENVWFENSVLTWNTIIKDLPYKDISVVIENVFEENPFSLINLASKIDSKNFKICFDIGHFNVFGKITLSKWINSIKPYLAELHIHDNNGTTDEHMALGDGGINFKALFSLINNIGKDLIITIEAHSKDNAIKSLEWLTKNSLLFP